MKKLFYIPVLIILFLSCDEGDPSPFFPEEKIVSVSIKSPSIDNINYGDQVEIIATIDVNVSNIEPAKVSFFSSKGDLTYKGKVVNNGDNIEIDTTSEIKFIYIPKVNEDPAFEGQLHKFEIIMTGCKNSSSIKPNCSAAELSFKTLTE
ncbi:hypothetical protein HN014_22390 (plasmid) [Aquimarina sp. TRL1]|uniref:hypothetical protein n=1 Tax=Aquimarina sp. (strain TRL1) TaxID=2736252 RepID=UPI00158D9EB7|nr:hypothetical protein [Aquimarina sp. TRL1]QKX07751.1 hypothetical protein HN014_22390 [Aquimarina sp. TRL1]